MKSSTPDIEILFTFNISFLTGIISYESNTVVNVRYSSVLEERPEILRDGIYINPEVYSTIPNSGDTITALPVVVDV
jgi:hypothetical protein